MMGTCVVLFVLAWSVVRLWSVPAAIGMCLFAMFIPPVAAIVANRKGPEDRWWDEKDPPGSSDSPGPRDPRGPQAARGSGDAPGSRRSRGSREADRKADEAAPDPDRRMRGSCGDPQSDAWWAELDERNRKHHRD